MKQDGISVILPTLNEKENLSKLIPQIVYLFEEKIAVDYEILVVDDGSNDGTADLIYEISIKNSNVKLITRTKRNHYRYQFLRVLILLISIMLCG